MPGQLAPTSPLISGKGVNSDYSVIGRKFIDKYAVKNLDTQNRQKALFLCFLIFVFYKMQMRFWLESLRKFSRTFETTMISVLYFFFKYFCSKFLSRDPVRWQFCAISFHILLSLPPLWFSHPFLYSLLFPCWILTLSNFFEMRIPSHCFFFSVGVDRQKSCSTGCICHLIPIRSGCRYLRNCRFAIPNKLFEAKYGI